MADWIDPEKWHVVQYVQALQTQRQRENSMANCGNCGGTGRIIYMDKGKMKDIPCPACGGSGEKK